MARKALGRLMAKGQRTHLTDGPVTWLDWMALSTMAEKPVRFMTEPMLMPMVVEEAAQQVTVTGLKVQAEVEISIVVMGELVPLASKARTETMPQRMAVVAVPVVVDPVVVAEVLLPVLTEMLTFLVKADRAVRSAKAATEKPDA